MIGWYLWFELDHAPDAQNAKASGLIMASVIEGARLVHVQSKASHEVGQDEREAARRNRRLKIRDVGADEEC